MYYFNAKCIILIQTRQHERLSVKLIMLIINENILIIYSHYI